MTEAELIETALAIALAAHRGQRDKSGAAYILHPVRLMAQFDDTPTRVVALLHDTVEDSALTLDDLRARGFPEAIVAGVEAMTRRADETYEAFIARAGANPLARRVKRADLADNMDLKRLAVVGEGDVARLRRYFAAWHRLSDGATEAG